MNALLAVLRAHLRTPVFCVLILAASFHLPAQTGLVLDAALKPEVLDPAAVEVRDILPLSDGELIVAGQFAYVNEVAHEALTRLKADGSVNPSLAGVTTSGPIFHLARGPGQSFYAGGGFVSINGVARAGLARLSLTGAVDAGFVAPASIGEGWIHKLLPVSDGGVYVVRMLLDDQGSSTVRIDRLAPTGAPAAGFTPIVLPGAFFADAAVTASDKVVLISGVNGVNTLAQRARRFTPEGAIDPDFQVPGDLNFHPVAVVVLPDESLVLGGQGGVQDGPGLIRLLEDGSRDAAYLGEAPFQTFFVSFMARLADGSVIVNAFGLAQDPPPSVMRFSPEGMSDGSFGSGIVPEPEGNSLRLIGLPDGDFIVSGAFSSVGGSPIAHMARVTGAGVLRAGVATHFSATGTIERIVPFADGGMLLGGSFARMGEAMRGGVVRLASNDAVVAAFPAVEGTVSDVVVDHAGRAIVLGDFPAVAGTTTAGIFRVGADNQVDATLLAGASIGIADFGNAAVLEDNALVVTRHWTVYDYLVPGIAKILPDGGPDESFQLDTHDTAKGPGTGVFTVAVDPSNRLLVTGNGSGPMVIQGIEVPGIARTDANGLLDPGFAAGMALDSGRQIQTRADGSFFVVGRQGGSTATVLSLFHFLADGTLDPGFALQIAADETVTAYTVTPDDALVVATVRGAAPYRVRRFTMSGAIDPTFDIAVEGPGAVACLTFDPQGRLWLGGGFTSVQGQRRLGLARFAPPALFVEISGPAEVVVASGATQELAAVVSGATGAVTLQWYFNGAPIAGATGETLSVSGFAADKAGDYTVAVTEGGRSAQSNPVALKLPVAPAITTQPVGVTASLGGALVLRVVATGLPPPSYQWYRDGVLLT